MKTYIITVKDIDTGNIYNDYFHNANNKNEVRKYFKKIYGQIYKILKIDHLIKGIIQ